MHNILPMINLVLKCLLAYYQNYCQHNFCKLIEGLLHNYWLCEENYIYSDNWINWIVHSNMLKTVKYNNKNMHHSLYHSVENIWKYVRGQTNIQCNPPKTDIGIFFSPPIFLLILQCAPQFYYRCFDVWSMCLGQTLIPLCPF